MTTPERIREADEASVAFQIALAQIGAKTVEDALDLWGDVPPDAKPATAARWLDKAVRLVMFRRRRSRELAIAYYRLSRALRTGKTVATPYDPEPERVSLSKLRSEFARLAGSRETTGDDEVVDVEEIPGLEAEFDRIEKATETEARLNLEALGPTNLSKKTSKIDTSKPASEVDAKREEAHNKAGSRLASEASRIVKNGARSAVYATGKRDRAVIGWIRLSRTGTPCGWCAMLLSRGTLFYGSKAAASGKTASAASVRRGEAEVADQYHPNCNCYAEPVYSEQQYDDSPLYELNRKYDALWRKHIKGKYSGVEALTVWRRLIRDLERQQPAQEAEPIAQEA